MNSKAFKLLLLVVMGFVVGELKGISTVFLNEKECRRFRIDWPPSMYLTTENKWQATNKQFYEILSAETGVPLDRLEIYGKKEIGYRPYAQDDGLELMNDSLRRSYMSFYIIPPVEPPPCLGDGPRMPPGDDVKG